MKGKIGTNWFNFHASIVNAFKYNCSYDAFELAKKNFITKQRMQIDRGMLNKRGGRSKGSIAVPLPVTLPSSHAESVSQESANASSSASAQSLQQQQGSSSPPQQAWKTNAAVTMVFSPTPNASNISSNPALLQKSAWNKSLVQSNSNASEKQPAKQQDQAAPDATKKSKPYVVKLTWLL